MNDLKFALPQLLKNPGFTVHPPQYPGPDRDKLPLCCYGGRAVVVLTLALRIETNMDNSKGVTKP